MFAFVGLMFWAGFTMLAFRKVKATAIKKGAVIFCFYGFSIQLCTILAAMTLHEKTFYETIGLGFSSTGGSVLAAITTPMIASIVAILVLVPILILISRDDADSVSKGGIIASWRITMPGVGGMWTFYVKATKLGDTVAMLRVSRTDAKALVSEESPQVIEVSRAAHLKAIEKLYEMGEFLRLRRFKIESIRTEYDKPGEPLFQALGAPETEAPGPLRSPLDIEIII